MFVLLGWVDSYVVAVGWAARLAGSHFPDQGLNSDYHSENASPNHWNSQDRLILEAWVHKESDTTETDTSHLALADFGICRGHGRGL